MAKASYRYVILGAGLAGGAAVAGIRAVDRDGTILLLGREAVPPYHRPPLTKSLWLGKQRVEDVFLHDDAYYAGTGVTLALNTSIVALDPAAKTVTATGGTSYHFEKLLLATGGTPRRLPIPGGELEGLRYYRELTDYLRVRAEVAAGRTATIIGGGFIGSELAAALTQQGMAVTLLFPDEYLVSRVLPEGLGRALTNRLIHHGVTILGGTIATAIARTGDGYLTRTSSGRTAAGEVLIAGIGITPHDALARQAGLPVDNGITVNAYLQTGHPDIYAAGDNAYFPYQALRRQMRVEHWDNARCMGEQAGRNMAGAGEPYTYLPSFFSKLFGFDYTGVGDINSKLETFTDWIRELEEGVIYFLDNNVVRGVLLCNLPTRVEEARRLIAAQRRIAAPEELCGVIRE